MIFSSENIFFLSQLCHQDSNSSYLALAVRFVLNCFTALRSLIFNSGLLRYHIFHVNCLCIWKDAKTSSRVYTRLKLSIWGWNWPVLHLTHSPRIYVCIPLVTSLTLPKCCTTLYPMWGYVFDTMYNSVFTLSLHTRSIYYFISVIEPSGNISEWSISFSGGSVWKDLLGEINLFFYNFVCSAPFSKLWRTIHLHWDLKSIAAVRSEFKIHSKISNKSFCKNG